MDEIHRQIDSALIDIYPDAEGLPGLVKPETWKQLSPQVRKLFAEYRPREIA